MMMIKLLFTSYLFIISPCSVDGTDRRRLGGNNGGGGGGGGGNNGGGGGGDTTTTTNGGYQCVVPKKVNDEPGPFLYQQGGVEADALRFCQPVRADDERWPTVCAPSGMTGKAYCSDLPGSCGYVAPGSGQERIGCCRYFINQFYCDMTTTFSHLPCICWDDSRDGLLPAPPIAVGNPPSPPPAPVNSCLEYKEDETLVNPFEGIEYGNGQITIGCFTSRDCLAYPVTRADGTTIPRCCIKDKCICRSAAVNAGRDCVEAYMN